MKRVAIAVALSTTACTAVFPIMTASTISVHNDVEPDRDHWSYGEAVGISAIAGALTDILVLYYFLKDASAVR